uniref:Uncharacterized protein n=1 Tax=Oryza barthii TaxID=65489 RepID=A0A0D3HSB3_9ORYZ
MGYIDRKVEWCTYTVGAFVQVNLLLLKEAFMRIWEVRSKWKTPQTKFITFETWGDTEKTKNSERKTKR